MRCVDGARVRSLDKVLADDVYAALACLDEISQRILRAVEAACEPKYEERWVVIDDLEVTERRKIAIAIFALRAAEANGPRNDGRNQEFVVEGCGSAGFVRVDADVVLLQACAVIVGALAEIPIGLAGLCECPIAVFGPIWARGFNFFEIWMRVALDLLFGVGHLLMVGAGFFQGHFRLRMVVEGVELKNESGRDSRDKSLEFLRNKFGRCRINESDILSDVRSFPVTMPVTSGRAITDYKK